MNDESLFERLASHAGPAAAVDEAFEDRLYSTLQGEMRRRGSLPPALLLAATVVLVLTITAAIAVGSGVIEPPWVNPLLVPQPSTASSSLSPTGQPEASPASGKLGAYPYGPVAVGSHSVTVDGLPLSFDMPNGDWGGMGPFYLAKDTYGGQGAEAIILWTTLPDTLPAPGVGGPIFNGSYVLCRDLLGTSPGSSSLADLATIASTVAGTDVVSGPSDVTVGGRAAKQVSFFATYDIMSESDGSYCDPGFFMSWDDPTGGAMWGTSVIPGDTYRVWFVDIDGKRLLIEAATHWNADASIGEEIQQIIDSIRFE